MLVHFLSTVAGYRAGEIYDLPIEVADQYIADGVANTTDRQETHTQGATEVLRSATYPVLSGVTFDGNGKVASYVRQGIQHNVTFLDANTVEVTNTTGAKVTLTLSAGKLVAAQWGIVVPVPPPVLATRVSFTGPTSGSVGFASSAFTVSLDGEVSDPVVVTPSDGGGMGIWAPPLIVLTNDNPSDTFSYLPISIGTKRLYIENDAGLENDPPIDYVVSNAPPPPPPSGERRLDFSDLLNSQYLGATPSIGVN